MKQTNLSATGVLILYRTAHQDLRLDKFMFKDTQPIFTPRPPNLFHLFLSPLRCLQCWEHFSDPGSFPSINELSSLSVFPSFLWIRDHQVCALTKEIFKTPLFRWHLHFIVIHVDSYKGCRLPRWHRGKESACQSRRWKRQEFDPWVAKIPWRRKWEPTPVFLPGESLGQGSLGWG